MRNNVNRKPILEAHQVNGQYFNIKWMEIYTLPLPPPPGESQFIFDWNHSLHHPLQQHCSKTVSWYYNLYIIYCNVMVVKQFLDTEIFNRLQLLAFGVVKGNIF